MIKFCRSLTEYKRRESCPVKVGNEFIGGAHPILLQSMTTTSTTHTDASAEQIIRIADAGGKLVRLTAQGRSEGYALKEIHEKIRNKGCNVPLAADIHFNPEVALIAAEFVEKVRINPGNFIDKRADFSHVVYSEEEYAAELERLRIKFTELLDKCKKYSRAIRIGVNHGSLSDRIMSRYGDTVEGMVESAMEFLRVCRLENFNDVVISMKSSNTQVVVHAYRALVAKMLEENMQFPLHLGVTEAGEGEDGRIKSAVGIGALLADGIGDTIRVSLTEEPENEIPVAKVLVDYVTSRADHKQIENVDFNYYNPFGFTIRDSYSVDGIGGNNEIKVIIKGQNPCSADIIVNSIPKNWVELSLPELDDNKIEWLSKNPSVIVVLSTDNNNGIAEQRAFFIKLNAVGIKNPVIIKRSYKENDIETLQIKAAADFGMLLIDGFGDAIWIENEGIDAEKTSSLSFAILQTTRRRITKTEYISCPGCGRTLYDIRSTLAVIKHKTSHLKGLKIGVMGCIVNGPGEMADADFGYVGAGKNKITLYRGKEVVKRNIPEKDAIDELIALIKASGKWIDK